MVNFILRLAIARARKTSIASRFASISHLRWMMNLRFDWENEKRMYRLETELKDALVELAALKGVEEALKKLEGV